MKARGINRTAATEGQLVQPEINAAVGTPITLGALAAMETLAAAGMTTTIATAAQAGVSTPVELPVTMNGKCEGDPPADCPADSACCKSCSAYQDGKCMALFDAHFDNNVCPFYKERTQAARQRIAAMERLEDLGRDDLIRKYYRNHARFERILAEELVGIGYGFESDAATGSTSEASTPEASAAGDIAGKDNTPEPNATEESVVENGATDGQAPTMNPTQTKEANA